MKLIAINIILIICCQTSFARNSTIDIKYKCIDSSIVTPIFEYQIAINNQNFYFITEGFYEKTNDEYYPKVCTVKSNDDTSVVLSFIDGSINFSEYLVYLSKRKKVFYITKITKLVNGGILDDSYFEYNKIISNQEKTDLLNFEKKYNLPEFRIVRHLLYEDEDIFFKYKLPYKNSDFIEIWTTKKTNSSFLKIPLNFTTLDFDSENGLIFTYKEREYKLKLYTNNFLKLGKYLTIDNSINIPLVKSFFLKNNVKKFIYKGNKLEFEFYVLNSKEILKY